MNKAVYLALVFDKKLSQSQNWRLLRIQLWETGHEFHEIDRYTVQEISDIVGYWAGKSRAESKLGSRAQRYQRMNTRGK